jgi:hypothetical protein
MPAEANTAAQYEAVSSKLRWTFFVTGNTIHKVSRLLQQQQMRAGRYAVQGAKQ